MRYKENELGVTTFFDVNSNDEGSDNDLQNRQETRQNNYEMFVMGFFYFFILQDPFVLQYLTQKYIPYEDDLFIFIQNLLEDLELF